jgi:predicted metal-dependent phosphoesterase TrpH
VALVGLLVSGVLLAGIRHPAAQASATSLHWYKGNTHTHTLNSDGDSTPDEVVRWYREHAYAFLVLSDHNFLTSIDGLNAVHGADEKFLVIKGEEVSGHAGKKPIHVNGLDVGALVTTNDGSTALDVMQRMVDGIRRANGVPHINHPNFEWAITGDDLKQVENTKLFEIYNGHPAVNNLGGGGVPGMEEVWDRLLSSGKVIYGIADDDAHVFKQPWNAGEPLPGRGWVYVHADRLAPRAIVEALDRGDFYASTGVELKDYQVTSSAITIDIKPGTVSKYRIQFIGRNGQILSEVTSSPAVYTFKGDELYVRAKIYESNGRLAWTQPVWRGR